MKITFLLSLISVGLALDWKTLELPDWHLPYYFYSHHLERKLCEQDPACPYQAQLKEEPQCFGYEPECADRNRFLPTHCPTKSQWIPSKSKQIEEFWRSGDFGTVKRHLESLEVLCQPEKEGDSLLECNDQALFCRAQNLVFDLRSTQGSTSYNVKLHKPGDLGGQCKLNMEIMKKWDQSQGRALQSWQYIVKNYRELPEPFEEQQCDVVFDKPTYILQNDATVNMFHHFCDFVNLYVTNHMNGSFSTDVQIIAYDTTGAQRFGDPFSATWKAFSDYPVEPFGKYFGKKLCFKDVIFALPPRQRSGLFYNMPLVDGCETTGLFRAFNEHVIHRLGIKQHGPLKDKVRITLLARGSKYRNILNENELLEALNKNPKYEAKIVTYKFSRDDPEENFLNQIKNTLNSDIFIGMHGAGLTHMLFLPHWAAVMEIYHCGDPKCYSNLARLRGVKYFTWTKPDLLYPEDEGHHPTLGAHEKFTNYSFDVDEFLRLVSLAEDHVIRHKDFKRARKNKYSPQKDEL